MIILVSLQRGCISLSNDASYSKSQKCDLRLVLCQWVTYANCFHALYIRFQTVLVVLICFGVMLVGN